MVDLTSLQGDLTIVPIAVIAVLISRFIVTRVGVLIEEKILSQIITILLLALVNFLRKRHNGEGVLSKTLESMHSNVLVLRNKMKHGKIVKG